MQTIDSLRDWILTSVRGGSTRSELLGDERIMRANGTWSASWGQVAAELQRMQNDRLVKIDGEVVTVTIRDNAAGQRRLF